MYLSKSVFKMLLDSEWLHCLKEKEFWLLLLEYLVPIFLLLVNWEMAIAALYEALLFI